MERRKGGERGILLWRVAKDRARKEISDIDSNIRNLFGTRLARVHIIGRVKTHLGEEIIDSERRRQVLQDWEKGFQGMGFQPGAGTRIAEAVLGVFENEQEVAEQKGDYRPKRKFFRT